MTDNPGANARKKYDDSEFIHAVKKYQPASTTEIANEVDCPRRSADYRLRKLRDQEKIDSKMAGNSLIWFVSEWSLLEDRDKQKRIPIEPGY